MNYNKENKTFNVLISKFQNKSINATKEISLKDFIHYIKLLLLGVESDTFIYNQWVNSKIYFELL